MDSQFADRVTTALDAQPVEQTKLDSGTIGQEYRVNLNDGRTVVAKVGETPLHLAAFMFRYLAGESDHPVSKSIMRVQSYLV